jgi:hypothetical protein
MGQRVIALFFASERILTRFSTAQALGYSTRATQRFYLITGSASPPSAATFQLPSLSLRHTVSYVPL